MSNDEAIKYLQQIYPHGGHSWLDEKRTEAIRMAIEALKEKPVSEDLGEATNNYVLNVRKGYPRVMDETDRYICNAFKAGANWQRSQLMRNAFETAIVDDWQYGKDADHTAIPAIHQRIEGYKVGDKVKIVVIPEILNHGTE